MENWMLYFIVINIITFLAYGLDKQKAKMRRWRIPEKVLLRLSFPSLRLTVRNTFLKS